MFLQILFFKSKQRRCYMGHPPNLSVFFIFVITGLVYHMRSPFTSARTAFSAKMGRTPLAPLPGADSPYQGEMSRRDKRGRDAGSAQPRLRGCCRFAIKPKSQIQFAVWKGRNGLRGKEAPRTAGTRSAEPVSDAPPAAISFLSQEKRDGRKECVGTRGAFCS